MLALELKSKDSLDFLRNFTETIQPAISQVYGTPVEDNTNYKWDNGTNSIYITTPRKIKACLGLIWLIPRYIMYFCRKPITK